MKRSKFKSLTNALFVGMILTWAFDLFNNNPLEFQGIKVGLHYFFEFPLLAIWMYRLTKYKIRWTIYAISSVVLFWVLTVPLHLRMGYDFYWIVNSALLFLTFVLMGAMVGFLENRSERNGFR